MLLKELFWITVDKELKKRGSKLKITESSPFEAVVTPIRRKNSELAPLKLQISYQPKEGNVKGHFILSYTVEAKYRELILEYMNQPPIKSLAKIIPVLKTQLEMTPEEEKAMQNSIISQFGEEDSPEPIGRAWIFLVADIISPHGPDLIDRISPWIAEWSDNLSLLYSELDKHIKKLAE